MARSGITFAGLALANPVIMGSSSLMDSLEAAQSAEAAGVAAIVTRLITPDAPAGARTVPAIATRERWAVLGDRRVGRTEGEAFVRAATGVLTIPVIAGIMASVMAVEPWIALARAVEAAGADAIELDLSLPGPEFWADADYAEYGGFFALEDVSRVREITAAVKRHVGIPVICKLTSVAQDLVAVGEACAEAGADGITVGSALVALPGVDIDHGGQPLFAGLAAQPLVASSGPWIKPIALKYTAQLASHISIDLASTGGVASWRDVIERVMLGARVVQLGSDLQAVGAQPVSEIVAGTERFLAEKGHAHVEEILGVAQKYIVPRRQMTQHKIVAEVIEEKCTGCWICLKRLADCVAFVQRGSIVVVDEERCVGCNLCPWVCPEDAFIIKEIHADGTVRRADATPH